MAIDLRRDAMSGQRGILAVGIAAGLIAVLGASPPREPAPSVTFAHDVAPILHDHCVTCHRPDGPAPFALVAYEDARQRATLIATVTASRYMPPWKPTNRVGTFVGERRLSQQQIDVLRQWAEAGAPPGDLAQLRMPPLPPPWQVGVPDLVVTLPEYGLKPDGTDVFRNFVVPVPVSGSRFVRGLEFRPGSTAVHHANIRLDYTPASRALDDADPAAGYEGLVLRSADYPDGHFLGWTPGQVPPLAPPGLAWLLKPGADLVVQLHMQPLGKPEVIRPQIGVFFTDSPPTRTPVMLRLGRQNIDIAAGDRDYQSVDTYTLPVDVDVHALQPHSHSRAISVAAWVELPDRSTRPLIDIARWDFRWQDVYRLSTPMHLPAGTRLHSRFRFDNSAANPRNPVLPPARAIWGFRSADEMADVWIQVMTASEVDRVALLRDSRRKAAAEDIVGGVAQLAVDPSNAALHDDMAALYLELGQPDSARSHFEATLRLRPTSAAAHYNVGSALEAEKRFREAADRYHAALALDPSYARAHVNLGNMLLLDSRVAEAVEQYRAAIDSEPSNAEAHNNLGRAVGLLGQRERAMEELREALRLRPSSTTHVNLAHLLLLDGQTPAAIEHFRQAMTLSPEWSVPPAGLSWVFSSHPDSSIRRPGEAIELAERALKLAHGNEAIVRDALAAAYASAGRFEEAIANAALASDLARRDGASELASQMEERVALYRRGRPFVQR